MKIKVNDYIRTKNGIIDKVIIEYNGVCASPSCNCKHVSCKRDYYDEDTIIKSIPNIMDLIENKDLIKIEYKLATGQKQQEILEIIKNREEKLFVNSWIRKMFIEEFKHFDIEIKSIITHEQIESMEYKIKE